MKIAFVVHDYNRSGGHSRYVAELASRFCKDHDVHVFANRIECNGDSGIRFHKVPALRANALTTVLTFAIPAAMIVDRGYDVVHSQGFCGSWCNVVTTHQCSEAWLEALKKLPGGLSWREWIFHSVAAMLERRLYYRSQDCQVIAVSAHAAHDIGHFYRCAAPLQVIHHGVDLASFSPRNRTLLREPVRSRLGIPPGETLFLFVGDLRKGASLCIQALTRLDRGVLVFVSPSRTAPYQSLAGRLGVSDRVLLVGSSDSVEDFYAAADIFLLPTPCDAFGMVVSEAMASGLPVIVSREAGAAELIQHGFNGLLLDDLDSEVPLARHMKTLLDDPAAASKLGAAARQTVEAYSWDEVAKRTMRVYEDALRTRRA